MGLFPRLGRACLPPAELSVMTAAAITVYQRPDPASRTAENGCSWIGECWINGRTYTAISRVAPALGIARQLAADGVADRPMEIRTEGSVARWYGHPFTRQPANTWR